MAKQGDNELSALYGARYLTPTFHSQATAFGLSAGCLDSGDGSISNRVSPEGEARLAGLYKLTARCWISLVNRMTYREFLV